MVSQKSEVTPKYMTARQFVTFSGLPYRIVLELIKSGKLKGFKSGKKTHYILVESYNDLATPEFENLHLTDDDDWERRISGIKKEG